MKITFQNVGQGDSIILEWTCLEGHNIGIIDCHRYEGTNPTVQYLIDNEVKSILFIILSHPHYDHYSGLLELLEFCEKHSIKIERFAHTSAYHYNYMQWFELDENKVALLESIFLKIHHLHKENLIKHIGNLSQDWGITLDKTQELRLECLSPSNDEFILYAQKAKFFLRHNDAKKSSQAANLLSTVLKITTKNSYILLTSDAEKTTFERLHTTCMDDYFNGKLTLCQIPHHGSLKNHYAHFWNDLKRSTNCPAVISAGEHGTYNHPEIQVVESFEQMNYKVHSTNHVNGMADFIHKIEEEILLGRVGTHDEFLDEYRIEGSQIFTFTKGRIQEVI